MSTKISPTETRPLSYRTDALRTICNLLMIPPTRISARFKYTNNTTVNRWLDGNDIYIASLLFICNQFNLDLLSFLNYDGKCFKTNLGDIIALEKAGLNLREILEEKGVEPCTFAESQTLSPLTPHDPLPTEDPSHPRHTPRQSAIGEPDNTATLPSSLIDKIVEMQCKAHEHEREMLEQQRRDMQTIIDDKDKQIAKLERELNRLKKQNPAPVSYFTGMIADDSTPDVNK